MMNNKVATFTLGDVRVIPAHNELTAFGRSCRLQPRVMEVLCYLAEHHERVIANEELTEQIWRGRVVTHGSVQKSINLLRNAFAELIGEQEVIVHYSKRGYQLQIAPVFQPSIEGEPVSVTNTLSWPRRGGRWLVLLGTLLVMLVASTYFYVYRYTFFIDKSHNTQFASLDIYLDHAMYLRGVEPHPDSKHLAYIQDVPAEAGAFGSDLIIRDDNNKDWLLARSSGVWLMLDWSSSGQHLVAVELINDGEIGLASEDTVRSAQLYDIHVFMLDIDNHRVQEKHRLSQWQGSINSVTWWDDDTLELVARQGDILLNQRYRYSLRAQRLEMVAPLDFISNPLLSSSYHQQTALASLYNGSTRIDFLGPDQTRFASAQLEFRAEDMSWLPDGSGVLVYANDESVLMIVYRDGETRALEFPQEREMRLSVPRYSVDGESIFFTRQRPEADLWQRYTNNTRRQLTDNNHWNYAAGFSPQGQSVAFASVRNNQSHIFLFEDNRERLIFTLESGGKITELIWAEDGQHLVFKSTGSLYIHNLHDGSTRILMGSAHHLTPLAVDLDTQQLLALRQTGEVNNLWRIDFNSGAEKQLTFGSVASAVVDEGNSYFQYAGQKGLWMWNQSSNSLSLVNRQLESHSKILYVDDTGVYYMAGGNCRESDIFFSSFDGESKEVYLPNDNTRVITAALHPEQGVLYSHCQLAPSDVVVLSAQ